VEAARRKAGDARIVDWFEANREAFLEALT
jgi:hypothetical protein